MDQVVLKLTTRNTPYGKNIIIGRISALMPDYVIKELMCIHETYEYTEFIVLLNYDK
jgi:hypothetical protein